MSLVVHDLGRSDLGMALAGYKPDILGAKPKCDGASVRARHPQPILGPELVILRNSLDQIDRGTPKMQTDRAVARSGVHFFRSSGLKYSPFTKQPDAVGQGHRFVRVVSYMDYCECEPPLKQV